VDGKKRCFVLMGFGVKVDYRSNRSLDLDKTYKIIKRAVEAAGLECIRADDIVHSGVIDKPMYENLLDADVAIADLSTSNENAIYELGVRHALKPRTTIVIAEKQFKFPFDLTHVVIRHYEHLGTGIDYDEAERLQNELTKAILTITAASDSVDSPVYTYLPNLIQPEVRTVDSGAEPASTPVLPAAASAETFTIRLEAFHDALRQGDFLLARKFLEKLRESRNDDPYIVQQLAMVTYRSRHPTPVAALGEARQILQALQPESSGDPETLGLWGAIHKRLWEETAERASLDASITAYERGFVMKRDCYNGINYAYMLDVRAGVQTDAAEATTDHVLARRVRRQLLDIADASLKSMPRNASGAVQSIADWYWLEAARVEAMMALGDPGFEQARQALYAKAPEDWMRATTEAQLDKLKTLISR
jgi:MAP3K TRAFs-binding domain